LVSIVDGHGHQLRQPLSKPGCEFGLHNRTCGNALHDTYCFCLLKDQGQALVGEEDASRNPSSSFVAIDKAMISGNAIQMAGYSKQEANRKRPNPNRTARAQSPH
jgi:hypothetical protein